MGKVTLYVSVSGFLLMQEGQSFFAWNHRRDTSDIEITVPISAVRMAKDPLENIDFEVLEKDRW